MQYRGTWIEKQLAIVRLDMNSKTSVLEDVINETAGKGRLTVRRVLQGDSSFLRPTQNAVPDSFGSGDGS